MESDDTDWMGLEECGNIKKNPECLTMCSKGTGGDIAVTGCHQGRPRCCICDMNYYETWQYPPEATKLFMGCVELHEQQHMKVTVCKSKETESELTPGIYWREVPFSLNCEECDAHTVSYACLKYQYDDAKNRLKPLSNYKKQMKQLAQWLGGACRIRSQKCCMCAKEAWPLDAHERFDCGKWTKDLYSGSGPDAACSEQSERECQEWHATIASWAE